MQHKNQPAPVKQLCAVTLLGNLVTKPEVRYRANPVSAITEITIATNSKWLDKKSNKYKEWTHYHHVKVEGDLVEQELLLADKGDIVLVQGYLSNIKPNQEETQETTSNHPPIVHANFIQRFEKGYTQTVNQIFCSAQLLATPKLITTQNNKTLTQVQIQINQQIYSIDKQSWQTVPVERALHVWGKQAEYLVENAEQNDDVMIEGKLSYLATSNKTQFIDAKTIHLFKK